MRPQAVSFCITRHAAWAPGLDTAQQWREWARAPHPFADAGEPALREMAPMLRRRAGFLGKMALQVAYQCLDGQAGIPTVFCSRHGEVSRAVELLSALAAEGAVSPAGFGLAVHNASAGLFSIAREDRANQLALAAGASSVEHGVIEACTLLADGAPQVMLVNYDNRLPAIFANYADCDEQPFAWAWLLSADTGEGERYSLQWRAAQEERGNDTTALPGALRVLQFQLNGDDAFERVSDGRAWRWARHA